MSSDEARPEAEWRFPVTAYECPEDQATEVERFVAGAEWQAERDAERIAELEAEVERLNDALDAAHVRLGMAIDWGERLHAKLDAVREYVVGYSDTGDPYPSFDSGYSECADAVLGLIDGESGQGVGS